MRVVLYWQGTAEEKMATGLIGPLRRWITPLVTAVWQGRGMPELVITARPLTDGIDAEQLSYVEALERAVFQ